MFRTRICIVLLVSLFVITAFSFPASAAVERPPVIERSEGSFDATRGDVATLPY